MISVYLRSTLLAIMLTLITATIYAEGKKDKPRDVDAALLLVPLNDAVSIDAGTLETRFNLNYTFDDSLRPEESICVPFVFLKVLGKDGSRDEKDEKAPKLSIIAYIARGSHSFLFFNSYYYMKVNNPPDTIYRTLNTRGNKEKGPWISQEDEWHSLAVTWKVENGGLHVSSFFDGKFCQKTTLPIKESNIPPFAKDDLIGIGGLDLSPATILSYRLSNRVRTVEEIASKDPLKPDKETTFFLDAETAMKFSSFERNDFVRMNKSGEINMKKKGAFFGKFKIVDTPEGKAIQFYNKRSR